MKIQGKYLISLILAVGIGMAGYVAYESANVTQAEIIQAHEVVDKAHAQKSLAPNFALKNHNGQMVRLSDFHGKLVVLEWTNHDCPFVKKQYNSNTMQSLQKKYTEKDVIWLSIISSAPGKQGNISPEQAKTLTQSRGAAPTHVLFDESGAIGRMYHAKTTPHMFIINKEGVLVYGGAIDSIRSADIADIKNATNYVSQALDELLGGNTVSMPETIPYGCSIKY